MPEPTTVEFRDAATARAVFGHRDEFLRLVEDELTVDLHARGTRVQIVGDPVDTKLAEKTLTQLYALAKAGVPLRTQEVALAVAALRTDPATDLTAMFLDNVLGSGSQKRVTPKTLAQKRYVDSIRAHDIVFGVGPAGTGKTYLAMAMAVGALLSRQVKRIILTRPAVEAGVNGSDSSRVTCRRK